MFIKRRIKNLGIFDACTEKFLSKLPAQRENVDVKDLLQLDAGHNNRRPFGRECQ